MIKSNSLIPKSNILLHSRITLKKRKKKRKKLGGLLFQFCTQTISLV